MGYTQNASRSVQSVQVSDPALQTSAETFFANGVLEHYVSTTFAGDMATPVSRQYAYQNQGQIQTDGALIGMTAQSNYSNGDFRSTATGAPTSVFRQVVQSGISDLLIFDQMSR